MKDNYVELFDDGFELIWKNAFLDDDNIITSIECINLEYGEDSPNDWLYKITYDKGQREAEVFHGELSININ